MSLKYEPASESLHISVIQSVQPLLPFFFVFIPVKTNEKHHVAN